MYQHPVAAAVDEQEPAIAVDAETSREFLSTIVLGPHVQRLPEELRSRFMDDALQAVGEPVVVDYVRLNIEASA